MKKLLNITKRFISIFTLLGLVLVPFVASADTNKGLNLSDPNTMVCDALGRVGIGCGVVQATPYSGYTPTPSPSSTSNSSNNLNLTASIFNLGSKNKRGDTTLVRAKGQSEIYEIIGGKRHLIPTKDIFYDYGFKDELIQNITVQELNRYPRVKLIKVEGDNTKTYYLTEGQMLRLIPDKKISDSYGDRNEDVVLISKKEFNYYPPDQFVFLEKSLYKDVFQIVNGNKRYVTPMAVQRMNIKDFELAPVNDIELAYYKTGSPIIN